MWNKQPTAKEVAKSQQRGLRGTTRELERDVTNLDRDMSKLEGEIRAAAKSGDEAGARTLARQLVRMKEQRTKLLKVKSQVTTTGYTVQSAANQVAMGQAMAKTSMAMGTMNKQMSVGTLQKVANTYEAESSKMEMKSEVMDDVYDSLFEGDEETEADVMNQIYDEIGLECANAAPSPSMHVDIPDGEDDQVEKFIRQAQKEI